MAKNLKLKSARAAMDMSQQALAEAVGVSRQTINAIEKGDYNPTLNLCIDICKALGKTLDEIFEMLGADCPNLEERKAKAETEYLLQKSREEKTEDEER